MIPESNVTFEDWKKALSAVKHYEQPLMMLVYADWLDERCEKRGDPGWPQTFEGGASAQGYLIRLRVEMNRLHDEGKDRTPEYDNLLKQSGAYVTAFNQAASKVGVKKHVSDFITRQKPVQFLTGLAYYLHLSNSRIDDTDLETLSWYRPLWSIGSVDLMGTNVTDAGLEALNRFEGLQEIKASNYLTDEGIRTITKAPYSANIHTLWLSGGNITNESVFDIMNLPNLKQLSLSDTSIDRTGFERLLDSPNAKNLDFLMITYMEHILPDGPHRPQHIGSLQLSLRVLDSDLKDTVKTQVLQGLGLFSDRNAVETMLRRERDQATDASIIR